MIETINEFYKEVLDRCPVCGRALHMKFIADFLEDQGLPDGELVVTCACDCKASQDTETRDRMNDVNRQLRNEGVFYNILRDSKYRRYIFQNDDKRDQKVGNFSRQYVTEFAEKLKAKYSQNKTIAKGIVFFGNTGIGKSFYAASIANAVAAQGYSVLMTTLPRLASDIGFSDTAGKFTQLKQYSLLVIDDWGVERKTEYMDELLQTIIDERYRQELPIIITTNRSREQLVYPDDDRDYRIISRLAEMTEFVPVKGTDRRMEALTSRGTGGPVPT